MKHLLIIISILLLSSFLNSCEKNNHKDVTLYQSIIFPNYNFNLLGVKIKLGTFFHQFFESELVWSQLRGKEKQDIYKVQVRKKYLFFGDLLPHGFGNVNFVSGGGYIGEWKRGKKHGQGKLSNPNNPIANMTKDSNSKKYFIWELIGYDGGWGNGKPHGKGTAIWIDGNKYVGEWKKGEKWNGIMFTKYGKIYSKYLNGEMCHMTGQDYHYDHCNNHPHFNSK